MDLYPWLADAPPDYGVPQMNDFAPLDVVRLPLGLSEHGVPEDALGVVLDVHYDPYVAYEIEVANEYGETIFVGAVEPARLELVFAHSRDSDSLTTETDEEFRRDV